MKTPQFLLISFLLSGFGIYAQNVNVPDGNFKDALTSNANVNTNGDTEIQVSEATAFTGSLDLSSQGIKSLTGIEAFTQLTGLNCSSNQLSRLDFSQNTALTSLYCYNNLLSSLKIKNGNNDKIPNNNFRANDNPNLSCIEVDNQPYASSTWTNIDSGVSFAVNCNSETSQNRVGIGTTAPHVSALLELNSSTQGFLPPRMSSTQIDEIPTPIEGLLVYCTDCSNKGLYVYNGTTYQHVRLGALK